MTIDLSVVKKIANLNGAVIDDDNDFPCVEFWQEQNFLSFAQAIYAMGAAEQKEKDAKICEQLVTFPAGHNGQWEGYGNVTTYRDGKGCAEAIRSQE